MKSSNDEHLILSKIVVENLFGRYNYALDLSPNNDLTIFFGLNGTGKTTILRTINNFAKLRFHEIFKEKFEKLIFYFYTTNSYDIRLIKIIFSHNTTLQEEELFIMEIKTDDKLIAHIKFTFDQYEVLYQWLIGSRYLKNLNIEHIIKSLDGLYSEPTLKDIMEMSDVSEEELKYDMDIITQKLYDELIEQNDLEHLKSLFTTALSFFCFFISSMRITLNSLTSLNESIEKAKPFIISADAYELGKEMQKERLQIELNKLKDLLFIKAVKEISNKIQAALKLKALTYSYVQIFQEKVNHFLKYSEKIIECNRSDGIILKDSKTHHKIPIEKLSSGENNLIIIFYHILFETEDNTLVMIDEPEISLHIDWQFDFIDKLLEIQRELKEKKPLMFLIATHSPQILSDHQDRAIDLKQ